MWLGENYAGVELQYSHLPCALLRLLNEYFIENSSAVVFLLSNLIIWHSLLLLSYICVYMPHLLFISYILVSYCFPYTLACLSLLCESVTWNAVWYMLYFLKLIILANSTPNLKPKVKFNFCFKAPTSIEKFPQTLQVFAIAC